MKSSQLAVLILFTLAGIEVADSQKIRLTTWNLEWFPNGSAKDASPEEQDRRINAADVLRKLISAASNRGNEWLSDQDANLS